MILSKGKTDVKCKNVNRLRITKKLEIATKGIQKYFPLPPTQVSNPDIIKNTFLTNSQWLKNPAYTNVSVKKEKKKRNKGEKRMGKNYCPTDLKRLICLWFLDWKSFQNSEEKKLYTNVTYKLRCEIWQWGWI